MDFYRSRPETHFVITCLIAKLPHHDRVTHGRICRSLEICVDLKIASENRQELATHFDLFRFRIRHVLNFERSAGPGQFQRNEKFVFRLVAVDVKSRLHRDAQFFRYRRSALNSDLLRRLNGQSILLR